MEIFGVLNVFLVLDHRRFVSLAYSNVESRNVGRHRSIDPAQETSAEFLQTWYDSGGDRHDCQWERS